MGERGTSSQVSVDFESHRRLEVEEARECSSWEEKGEVESKGSVPPERTTALPFIRQREQVTLMRCDKPGEREGVCMLNRCTEGAMQVVQSMNAPNSWCMHESKTTRGGFQLVGGCRMEAT
jgi:hypothetical protein